MYLTFILKNLCPTHKIFPIKFIDPFIDPSIGYVREAFNICLDGQLFVPGNPNESTKSHRILKYLSILHIPLKRQAAKSNHRTSV